MSMVLSSSASASASASAVRTAAAARPFAAHLMEVMADGWRTLVARLEAAGQPREPRTPEELIEWANAYEATQPSYAADLRAAALRTQEMSSGAGA